MRDLGSIRDDFVKATAQKRQAWAESNYEGAIVCDDRIDRLLVEAITHPQYKAAKEPAA